MRGLFGRRDRAGDRGSVVRMSRGEQGTEQRGGPEGNAAHAASLRGDGGESGGFTGLGAGAHGHCGLRIREIRMLSWEIVEHGKPLQKVMRDTPVPKGSEVLMRITRAGVCHSDLHIWDGYFDLGGGKRFYVKDRG